MKKIIQLCVIMMALSSAHSQEVVHGEYFIDTDYGFGTGTPFTIAITGEDIIQSFNIPYNAFPNQGYHYIFFRTMDNNGKWSITSRRLVQVGENTANNNIIHGEYFIDADYGFGNGTPFFISASSEDVIQSFNIPYSAFPNPGYHFVFFRTKDDSGKWSITTRRLVQVDDNLGEVHVINAEYFFDTDNGFGGNASISLTASVDSTWQFYIPSNQLPQVPNWSFESDTLFIRAKENERNGWSLTTMVETCSAPTSPSVAGNNEICAGQSTAFLASAQNTDVNTTYSWTGPNDFTANGNNTGSISINGIYTCEISNTDGCSAVVSTELIVHPLPPAPDITENGGALQSSASSGNQWYFNGNPIVGATGTSYSPSISGNYYVMVTDENGCESVSGVFNYTVIGIEDTEVQNVISVFPNPFNSTLYIQNLSVGNHQVVLMNALGQTLMRTQISTTTAQIDLGQLAAGVYFLKIETASGSQVLKIQKQ